MLLCLLSKVVSYFFYSKRPTEFYRWIHANHIYPKGTNRRVPNKEQKEERENVKGRIMKKQAVFKNLFKVS